MNPIKKNGKYFIKDAEISDSKNDKFKHLDIAKNILNIIENNIAPFNIAIVGKWGLGKSSLINIVKEELSVKEDYIIEDINAWKYEKEALKRVLLRRILSKLEYTNKSALTEFLDGLTSHKGNVKEVEKSFLERLKTEWIPLIGDAIVIYIIGVILSIVGQCIISKVNVSTFNFNEWISFVLNGFASNFYIPLLVVLFENYINSSSGRYNFKITPPITSVDEYERELENRLSKQKYKNKKIIVIVDDLDRLTPNKIVEALDAIKAFVGYSNFIFIVPFDDTILKDAIKKEKTNFTCNEHLTIESDLFLDKLFQYRISLPNIIQSDIPQYAIEAAQKDATDLVELCGQEDFKLICKEILIHKKVATPRQAKKIVNIFASNLLLGYRREMNGVSSGTFTSLHGKRFLAKMSVLQADFPSFYSNLFVDKNIIDEFLTLTDRNEISEISNELLLSYFEKVENNYILNKTGESLSMFLHRTSAVTVDNISRFLYMNEDRLSELFGNEFSSNIRDGLLSGDYKLVREKVESNLDKDISNLLYEILSNSDPVEFEFCCIGIINLSDIEMIQNDRKLLSLLNDRLLSIFISHDKILAKNLNLCNAINIFQLHNQFSGIEKLILNQFCNEENDINRNLSIFFERESVLSKSVKDYIKELISKKCSISETKLTFDSLFKVDTLDIEVFFEEYLSDLNMFERLYDGLISLEEYDDENTLVKAFVKIFEMHLQNKDADKVLTIIVSNLDNSEFAKLLIHVMVNYTDKFNEEDIISIASCKLIEAFNDEINNDVNLWLSSVNWKIESDKDEIVDKYIEENLENVHIDSMLLNVAKNDQVDLLPNTISSIHRTIFNKCVKISTLYELQKQYAEKQMTDLIEQLKPAFINSCLDENILNYATEILKKLSEDDANEKYISLLADYIYSQNSNYTSKMIDKIQMMNEFKNGISSDIARRFISWTNSYFSSYPVSSVIILDIFKDNLLQNEYLTFGTKIMQYATEDILELALSLLRVLRSEFKEETVQIKSYKNFLVDHLTNKNCRKSIMKDIITYYSSIGDVEEFACEVIKYNDIVYESTQAIKKFTIKYTDEKISSIVKSIIETASEENIDNARNILYGWLKVKYGSIICQLIEEVDDSISVIYGFNLIKLSISMEEVDLSSKINLICIMLEICDDTMIPNILSECKKIGKLTKNNDKRKLGESLYNAFRNTTLSTLKEEIFSLVQSTGTKNAFEIDKERNKREFSDEERNLVKHNK